MAFKKKVKQFFKTFDFFSHNVSFRYADQPAYESVTGGVCSIIMIIAFIAIFMGTAINTFNKVYIYSTTTTLQDIDPSYYQMGTDSFMFAISLTGINMNQGQRWFDVYMQLRSYDNAQGVRNKTYIPLVPCQKQVWTKIGQNLGEVYDRLGLDTWLCPQDGLTMQLQGKYTSEVFKFYKFAVKECDPEFNPDRPCVNQSVIQGFLDDEQAFNFNFYFVNMILNPGSHQYLTYYLDDLNYFPFSRKSGVNANLFLSTFNITTDDSILPWEDMKEDVGGIVTNTAQMLNYEVRQDQYMKFYLRKSSLSISVQRSFRKADDTLSYVGGLFSAILSILVLMSLYNEFSYELEIAKNIYHYQKGKPLDSEGFNFFVYLGYLIYLIFDKFSIDLPWKRMREYHHSLEEVRKQMDMRLIMKKILYSERMAYAILDQHKSKMLHLQEPLTLQEAEEIRKDHRFYEKLQRYASQLTIPPAEKKEQQSQGVIQVQNSMDEMMRTGYFPSQASPKKKRQTNKLVKDNKVTAGLDSDIKQDIELEEDYQQRIQRLKKYIVKLKKQEKNGDHVSKRILQKYDSQLLGKLIDHNSLLEQENRQRQRKFNMYPKEVFTFSEESEVGEQEPDFKNRDDKKKADKHN